MTGSVFHYQTKAGRRWGYVHGLPGGGQKRRRGYKRKSKAEEALQESLWDARQAGEPPPSYTVVKWVAQRIEARRGELAPSTHERYQLQVLGRLEAHPFGGTPLARVTPQAVQEWIDWLGGHLNPNTVRSTWCGFLAQVRPLLESGALPKLDPSLPRAPTPGLRVWSAAELRLVFSRLTGDALFPLIGTLATTGVRPGELLAATWQDYTGEALVITRSVGWVGGKPVVKDTKTGVSRRVELYPETCAWLDAHRTQQRKQQLIQPGWRTEGLIFPRSVKGGWWKVQNLSSQFQQRIGKLPVPKIRLYDLRHTHASHLLAAGVPVPTVAARLGHSVQVCLRTYTHLVPGQQTEAVRLGAAFLGLQDKPGDVLTMAKKNPMTKYDHGA